MSKAREQTLFLYLNSVQNKPPFLLVIKRFASPDSYIAFARYRIVKDFLSSF